MLNKVKFFFKYLLRFRAPVIQEFHYIDYVITNKSYFLISWKTSFGYKLRIRPFYSSYFNRRGSIYTLVPEGIDSLDIEISNVWYSKKITVHLKKIAIESDFEFDIVPDFKEWRSKNIHLPAPQISSRLPYVKGTGPKLSKPIISVRNLTFLKP